MGTKGMKLGPSKMRVEIAGRKFGMMTVLRFAESRYNGTAFWLCRCDCGSERIVQGSFLRNGKVKSCGCWKARTHGMEGTKVYNVWSSMKARCSNPNHRAWKNYGGRGIKVCKRWMEFENFYADMGDPTGVIDRIDPDGDYTPANCRWASWSVSNKNQRRHLKH